MFPFPDTATANPALRAQLDAQVHLIASLSRRSADLFTRISELNLQLARQSLDTALDTGRQLFACADPAQLASTAMQGWQPLGEHVRNYQTCLVGVLTATASDTQSDVRSDLDKAAAQTPMAAMFAGATAPNTASDGAARPH